MKKQLFLVLCLSLFLSSHSQNILKTVDGDEILFNATGQTSHSIFATVNTSDESTELKSVFKLKNKQGVLPTQYVSLGIKAKASDGIATLFTNGTINSGANFNLSYSKINLFFKSDAKSTDFFTLSTTYKTSKHTLFDGEKTFENQLNKVNFTGYDVSFNYNILLKGKHLLTAIMGYSDKNNSDDLDQVEIKDYYNTNPASSPVREVSNTTTARIGTYQEFNTFPLKLGYTMCPSEHEAAASKLKFGFTVYYSTFFSSEQPNHNLGSILFFTKQNEKSGVRVPLFGIGLFAKDITNNLDSDSSLGKRISVNITTTFNLFSF